MKEEEKNQQYQLTANFLKTLDFKFNEDVRVYNFLDYTKKWTDLIDRGGLVRVNDDVFIFARRVEQVVRKVMNINTMRKYHGEDLREGILAELHSSKIIANAWESLARKCANLQISNLLKKQFLRKWVDIRGHAFVNTYIQIVKRKLSSLKEKGKKDKLSSAAEPSLRKTLS